MKYQIETYKDRKGLNRWRLRHRNGRIVADSGEGYTSQAAALRSLGRLLDTPREQFRLVPLRELAKRAAKVVPALVAALLLSACSTMTAVGDAQGSPAVQGAVNIGSAQACQQYAVSQPAAAAATRNYLLTTTSAALGCLQGIDAGLAAPTATPAP